MGYILSLDLDDISIAVQPDKIYEYIVMLPVYVKPVGRVFLRKVPVDQVRGLLQAIEMVPGFIILLFFCSCPCSRFFKSGSIWVP